MMQRLLSLCDCRAREKINKPLLRNRRRGNDMDSLQKLQTIKQNLEHAHKVAKILINRERKKRDIAVRSQMLAACFPRRMCFTVQQRAV